MSRSKCVVCGKTRYRKYMKSVGENKNGFGQVWVCSSSVDYDNDYLKVGDYRYSVHDCIQKYLELKLREIEIKKQEYIDSVEKLIHFEEVKNILQEENVRPGVTKKLQL